MMMMMMTMIRWWLYHGARSLEVLREKIHLRVRTNTISAIQRIRNCLVR